MIHVLLYTQLYKSSSLLSRISHLLTHRKLPSSGWSEQDVSELLSRLSRMDSNNLPVRCGVGEREGRVFSGEDGNAPYFYLRF